MSNFTVNFNASTIGTYTLGYRTYADAPNTYHTETVNVLTIGLQHVMIAVEGSLYCAEEGITYNGYVIADCQDPVDTTGNGHPDAAVLWEVPLPKVQSTAITKTVTCAAPYISDVTIDMNGATGCADGTYNVVVSEATVGDERIAATITLTMLSGVGTIDITNPGSYKETPNLTVIVSGCSATILLTAIAATCPQLHMGDYVCLRDDEISQNNDITLLHNEEITFCVADDAVFPSYYDVTDIGASECIKCEHVLLDCTAIASGSGVAIFNKCWDQANFSDKLTLESHKLNHSVVLDLGCIMPDSLTIIQGSLVGLPTKTVVDCL